MRTYLVYFVLLFCVAGLVTAQRFEVDPESKQGEPVAPREVIQMPGEYQWHVFAEPYDSLLAVFIAGDSIGFKVTLKDDTTAVFKFGTGKGTVPGSVNLPDRVTSLVFVAGQDTARFRMTATDTTGLQVVTEQASAVISLVDAQPFPDNIIGVIISNQHKDKKVYQELVQINELLGGMAVIKMVDAGIYGFGLERDGRYRFQILQIYEKLVKNKKHLIHLINVLGSGTGIYAITLSDPEARQAVITTLREKEYYLFEFAVPDTATPAPDDAGKPVCQLVVKPVCGTDTVSIGLSGIKDSVLYDVSFSGSTLYLSVTEIGNRSRTPSLVSGVTAFDICVIHQADTARYFVQCAVNTATVQEVLPKPFVIIPALLSIPENTTWVQFKGINKPVAQIKKAISAMGDLGWVTRLDPGEYYCIEGTVSTYHCNGLSNGDRDINQTAIGALLVIQTPSPAYLDSVKTLLQQYR